MISFLPCVCTFTCPPLIVSNFTEFFIPSISHISCVLGFIYSGHALKFVRLSVMKDISSYVRKYSLAYNSGESFELRQTTKTLEHKIMELEGQVQNLEQTSSEKDTFIEKYKMETKEGE